MFSGRHVWSQYVVSFAMLYLSLCMYVILFATLFLLFITYLHSERRIIASDALCIQHQNLYVMILLTSCDKT